MRTKDSLVPGLAQELIRLYPNACRTSLTKAIRSLAPILHAEGAIPESTLALAKQNLVFDVKLHASPITSTILYDMNGGRLSDIAERLKRDATTG